MNEYLNVLKKYATFTGRARRREYWLFYLMDALVTILLVIVDALLGGLSSDGGLGVLSGLYSLAVLLPGLAVTVRRLHDTGRSGWWLLIGLVPLVGSLILLVFTLQDSQPGSNKWGPSPKERLYPGLAN